MLNEQSWDLLFGGGFNIDCVVNVHKNMDEKHVLFIWLSDACICISHISFTVIIYMI